MAGVLLPILRWFIGGGASNGPKVLNFLVRSPWSTIDIIGQVKQPILFISGLQDEMVPPSHMQMLYEKAVENNSRCLFVDFPDGMHMDTWESGGDRYWRTIRLFLDQYVLQIKGVFGRAASGARKLRMLRSGDPGVYDRVVRMRLLADFSGSRERHNNEHRANMGTSNACTNEFGGGDATPLDRCPPKHTQKKY